MDYKIAFVLNSLPLYRIMPLKWLNVMIKERKNTLVRPSCWSDPYETNYSNSVIATEKGDIPLDASHWFGQCWSICEESAIMWQAFQNHKESFVKIKVDAEGLMKGLSGSGNGLRIAILEYIRYFSPTLENDYKDKLHDVISFHKWTQNFIKHGVTLAELYPMFSLLTKRDLFKHEEEVRLLLFDKSSSVNQKKIEYPFDPSLIREIVVDPDTSRNNKRFYKIERDLCKILPNKDTIIRKSEIYADNKKFFIRYNG